MHSLKKTYHFLSTLTLLLFLSSIVIPVSVSAATLFCDMEMTSMAQPHAEHNNACCDFHDVVPVNQTTYASSSSSCQYQDICAEAVSSNQMDKEAIPQFTKSFVAALVFTDIFIGETDNTERCKLESDSFKHQRNQPIFLLNSAFLN